MDSPLLPIYERNRSPRCCKVLNGGICILLCCFSCSWITVLVATAPIISLTLFYLPAFDKTLPNATALSDPYFLLKLENPNYFTGFYYDPINVTFYDNPNRTCPIGNATIPQFYQKDDHSMVVKIGRLQVMSANGSVGREAAAPFLFAGNGSRSREEIGVDVITSVRHRFGTIPFWTSKRHHIKVAANVTVSDQGGKIDPNKDIPLIKV